MSHYNSHKKPIVCRIVDNEIGPNPRSKVSPTPIRTLKRKPNFCQDKEPRVEDLGDAQIQCGRSTFEIPTRDESDLEHDGSDFGDDKTVLEDGESELEDGKSDLEVIPTPNLRGEEPVFGDNESDLEEFPMRNKTSVNPSRYDYLELSLVVFNSWKPYRPERPNDPSRWALLLEDPSSNVEEYYQLVDGPYGLNIGKPFKFLYESGKLGSLPKPDERHHITWIKRDDKSKFYCTAREAAQHKFSQQWVLETIWNLEWQGIVLRGRANVLRTLGQEDPFYRETIDMLSQIEQERARPTHRKLMDWARERPDAILKSLKSPLEWIDCRMAMLAIDHDPEHKYRNMLQKQFDSMEDYRARVHHEVVKFAKRFKLLEDGPDPDCSVVINGVPINIPGDALVAQDSHLDGEVESLKSDHGSER